MDKFIFVAPCLFGLESFVKDEVYSLGYEITSVTDGRVCFEGDLEAAARANVGLACAERVLIRLAEFQALDFEALYQGVKAIPWADYIGKNDAFPVSGHALKSRLHSVPDCQRIIKKAIVDRLSAAYGLVRLPETGGAVTVEFLIMKDTVAIMLDTTGFPLHKRGYRAEGNAAPIRETLAAAMLRQMRYRGREPFADPMCGSGTIVIEAALRATGQAPGLTRQFAYESYGFMSGVDTRGVRQEAAAQIHPPENVILASDIDPEMCELTKRNAKKAGVEALVTVSQGDVRAFNPGIPGGLLICNPPYGERMSEAKACEALYADMGRAFSKLDGWRVGVITSHEEFERFYGRRADNKRKMYNGMIKCDFYQFFKPRGKG
ncbi:MAG TPA: class I SAM-dependent RNA methyltransferase [Terriglobales bacterium]|nr:class I SAM-dependent RNA methyltransferase [Terriglobales bacterium]